MSKYNDLLGHLNNGRKRILIFDNNNIQFCYQNIIFFPVEFICENYDLILVPDWVLQEINHSEERKEYLFDLPIDMLMLVEEEDYLPLVDYNDQLLINLFKAAASPFTSCKRFFKGLSKGIEMNNEIPDNWVSDFYDNGFSTRIAQDGRELKKNAGEISVLVLSYLLCNKFSQKIDYITISTSDYGCYIIKKKILDYFCKSELRRKQTWPTIGFKSTDLILIEAFKKNLIRLEHIEQLRPNPRTCVYIKHSADKTSDQFEGIKIDTPTFIDFFEDIQKYSFIF